MATASHTVLQTRPQARIHILPSAALLLRTLQASAFSRCILVRSLLLLIHF